jgi:hypothetical protein
MANTEYQYPGMIALEDIEKGEDIVKVPKKSLITTQLAYTSVLQSIFEQHPDVFSLYAYDWEGMQVIRFNIISLHNIRKKHRERVKMG